MRRTRRTDVILMDSARKAARTMLADQIANSREGLSPHRLGTLWKATQLRKIEGARREAMGVISENRSVVAGAIAALAGLIVVPALFGKSAKRNASEATRIDGANPDEGMDDDRQPEVEPEGSGNPRQPHRKGSRKGA